MEALIKSTQFVKEYESKYGTLYLHKITYDDKTAYYSSKSKDQNKFVKGQKAEFTEIEKEGQNGKYLNIKPVTSNNYSGYKKALKKEQSKYSGFADSYVKDLLTAGVIKPEIDNSAENHNDIVMQSWKRRAYEIFEHMVSLDKTLEQ